MTTVSPPVRTDRRLVVCGAGGHARASLDTVLADPRFDVLGCVGPAAAGRLQVPYLGPDEVLADLSSDGVRSAFVAIGDNRARWAVARALDRDGWTLPTFVAASAVVATTVTIGRGTLLMPGVVVNAYTSIGDAVVVNTAASVDHDCEVGHAVHLAPGTRLAGTVTVGEGALLGVAAAALPGTTIGEWAVVGGGAVVIRDIPARSVSVGVPARPVTDAPELDPVVDVNERGRP